jgi:hypothetical protein
LRYELIEGGARRGESLSERVAVLVGPQLAEHVENQTAGAKLEPKVLENLAVVCMRWLETPCVVCDTWYMANSLWPTSKKLSFQADIFWAYSCC